MDPITPAPTPAELLAQKSIRWKVAAGIVAVMIVGWSFLARPILDYYMFTQGLPVPPAPSPLSLTDVFALIGRPFGASNPHQRE